MAVSSASTVPLGHLIILFCVLLFLGISLTLPLFRFNYRKFLCSSLFIKIIFWIPIFLVFLGILYARNSVRFGALIVLMVAAFSEFVIVIQRQKTRLLLTLYFLIFAIALTHFYFIGAAYETKFINLLVTICFATVLSDVTAFFFGNYLGVHKLPALLNKNKSWEGVFGQLVGALLGVLLVNAFVTPVVSIGLFLPLGIGGALGDLANSYAKRKANIKDWSSAIPGHGGFIDRLSSLAGSAVLVFYFLKLTGII